MAYIICSWSFLEIQKYSSARGTWNQCSFTLTSVDLHRFSHGNRDWIMDTRLSVLRRKYTVCLNVTGELLAAQHNVSRLWIQELDLCYWVGFRENRCEMQRQMSVCVFHICLLNFLCFLLHYLHCWIAVSVICQQMATSGSLLKRWLKINDSCCGSQISQLEETRSLSVVSLVLQNLAL